MTSIYRKVFSRAFRSHWDRENRWRIDGDMAEWSLWQRIKQSDIEVKSHVFTGGEFYRQRYYLGDNIIQGSIKQVQFHIGVGVVGRECPRAKAESKKQCVDLESTSVWMGIGWRWSRAHTREETRGIQREFRSERADALRRIGLVVAQMSSTRLPVCAESWEPRSSFLRGSRRAESLVPPE